MRKKHLFKSLTLFIIFMLAFQSCTDDNFVEFDSEIQNKNNNSLKTINNVANPYYRYDPNRLYTVGSDIETIYIYSELGQISLDNGWITALNQAVSDWNSKTECLNFVTTNIKKISQIRIFETENMTVDASNHPFGGEIEGNGYHSRIDINLSYNNGITSQSEKINILAHEIGHSIGFKDASQGSAQQVGVFQDSNSIMNNILNRAQNSLIGLTDTDGDATNFLYNNCNNIEPTISGPSEFCVNSGSQSYSLLNSTLTPSWQVTPNLTIESSSNTSIIVSPVDTGESSTGIITASFPDGSSATFNVNIIGRSASQNLSIVSGPDFLQHYQSGLFFTNFSDDYDNVEWVIYSNTFQNAIQHFNIQSPAGNNQLNALVEVLPTAPPGNYVVQCRISSECATYYIEKNLTVKRGRPQIFDI